MNGQTALITGASGGFGLDFAHKFAENGYNVILVARSKDQLEKLAGELEAKHKIKAVAIAKDLSDPTAPQALYDEIKAAGHTVDVLVNNAGFASYGKFHELDMHKEMQMIALNVATLAHLTRLYLPEMVARKRGKIVNVGSTASFLTGPLMATYYATKNFVLTFSEAIANELEGTGVTVTALCPGAAATGFQSRAAMEASKLVQGRTLMTSRQVVDEGYAGMLAGKTVVIPGFSNKVIPILARIMPRAIAVRMVRNAQERQAH